MTDPSTRTALAALGTGAPAPEASLAQRAVDGVTGWLSRRTSRRGFLVRAGVVGSALAVDPVGYVLRPGTAYASVCGPGASCNDGWTVFCATINHGVNACPPGSIAAGWWKADGASLCGGSARYIVDCNATCSRCSSPGSRAGICAKSCQSCSCTCGPGSSCDQRRVCCNDFRYGQCNTQVSQVGAVQCRVVSCTPPWHFEKCSTSPATDNRTVDHNSSELPSRYTAITKRYIALGENGSFLGASVYGEVAAAGGSYQRYQRGRISYSSGTGAHEVRGAILHRYSAVGYESGILGFPTSGEYALSHGAYQIFQHGRIYYSPGNGAWEVRGSVFARWTELGRENSLLGYPLSAEHPVRGGVYQQFQHGRIFWSSGIGSWEVHGAIYGRYAQLGFDSSLLGFPTSGENAISGGVYQQFQHGRIYWGSGIGAWDVHGGIGAGYARLGYDRSPLGLPTSGEQPVAGGVFQTFRHGRYSYRSGLGAHWAGSAIAAEHVRLGGEAGSLGFPTTDEFDVPADDTHGPRRRVVYQGGTLTYDPATGDVTRS